MPESFGAVKKPARKEPVPYQRQETIRHEIITVLQGMTLSAREISAAVSVSERDAYEHLEHVRRTLSEAGGRLVVTPAECLKCGFVFKKRDKLKSPGRCPVCHEEHIQEPLFSIAG